MAIVAPPEAAPLPTLWTRSTRRRPAFAAVRTLGLAIVATGVGAYATDVVYRLRRASTPAVHARVAVAAALSWLRVACAASLAAADPTYARVALVAALAGWAGSMVLAHLFHIGVRVVATATLGEDDETRPWDLLSAPLAFAAVALYEAAVGALALGAWRFDAVPLATAGAAGLAVPRRRQRCLRAAARTHTGSSELTWSRHR